MGMRRGVIPVEVRGDLDPEGVPRVVLQLPDGFALLHPEGARLVAKMLVEVADEVEQWRSDG